MFRFYFFYSPTPLGKRWKRYYSCARCPVGGTVRVPWPTCTAVARRLSLCSVREPRYGRTARRLTALSGRVTGRVGTGRLDEAHEKEFPTEKKRKQKHRSRSEAIPCILRLQVGNNQGSAVFLIAASFVYIVLSDNFVFHPRQSSSMSSLSIVNSINSTNFAGVRWCPQSGVPLTRNWRKITRLSTDL